MKIKYLGLLLFIWVLVAFAVINGILELVFK